MRWVLVAVLLHALGCATPNLTGPSTLRCAHGAAVVHTAAGDELLYCEDGLVVTGTLSDNGRGAIAALAGMIAGFLARGL